MSGASSTAAAQALGPILGIAPAVATGSAGIATVNMAKFVDVLPSRTVANTLFSFGQAWTTVTTLQSRGRNTSFFKGGGGKLPVFYLCRELPSNKPAHVAEDVFNRVRERSRPPREPEHRGVLL